MKVLDPGHHYELTSIDEAKHSAVAGVELRFVKREGPGYPGNVGSYPGTNLQDVLRVLIDRVKYLDGQIADEANYSILRNLRDALFDLELRAAIRHGRKLPCLRRDIENEPVCATCGHIACNQH